MTKSISSISQTIYNFAIELLQKSGYSGVFALMIMNGATLPVPSEVVLTFSGYYLVFQDHFNFWLVVIVAVLGSLIGTLIDYGIGYYLGRAAILRYGRIVRLNENHLQLTEVWFAKYGNISVLLARFIPLLGTLVAFPAGIAEMKIPRFIAYSLVGIFVWDAILTYMGVEAGRNFNTIVNTLQRYFLPIGLLATVITVVVVFLRLKSRKNDGLSENKNRPAQ